MAHFEQSILNNRFWINYGYNFKQFDIGMRIDGFSAQFNLIFFWFGVEW